LTDITLYQFQDIYPQVIPLIVVLPKDYAEHCYHEIPQTTEALRQQMTVKKHPGSDLADLIKCRDSTL